MSDPIEVPPVHCNAEPPAVYAAMADAWRQQIGTEPPRASLLVLLSQWALETDAGRFCLNWNIAGIKRVPGDGHDWATYDTHEVIGGVDRVLQQQFRAYASLGDGVSDYLRELRHTFGFAWPAVDAGDVVDFAHRLKQRGYYTAPESQYASGLQSRYAQMQAAVPVETPTDPPAPDPVSDELVSEIESGTLGKA